VLVIVVAWALAAVLMLTGTLLAARQIDDRVRFIRGQTSAIDEDLDAIRLAGETGRVARRIDAAARPLSGQLDQVIGTAERIDFTGRSILGSAKSIEGRAARIRSTAASIEGTVASIGGRVGSIEVNARSIESNARSIEGRVGAIEANARSIEGRVGSIEGRVAGIGGSVRAIGGRVGRIRGSFAEILPVTRSIDPGVAEINANADRTTDVVTPIAGDIRAILDQVGFGLDRAGRPGHQEADGGKTIHGHANSIDCSLGRVPPPSQECGR